MNFRMTLQQTRSAPAPAEGRIGQATPGFAGAVPVGDHGRSLDLSSSHQSTSRGTGSALPIYSARDDLRTEPRFIRVVIIAMAVIFLTVFVVLPLVVVFAQAFSKGIGAYFSALSDPEALSAIRLTLCVAAISVGLNLVFGVVAAWAIAKFDFRGKTFLISLIDLPFSVSPVISGLVFVLLFGAQGYWGPWLQSA